MSKQDLYIEYSTAVGSFGPDSAKALDLRARHRGDQEFLTYANAVDALKRAVSPSISETK